MRPVNRGDNPQNEDFDNYRDAFGELARAQYRPRVCITRQHQRASKLDTKTRCFFATLESTVGKTVSGVEIHGATSYN